MKDRKKQLDRLKQEGLLADSSVASLRKRLKKRLREERREQTEKIEGLKQELAQIQLRLNT